MRGLSLSSRERGWPIPPRRLVSSFWGYWGMGDALGLTGSTTDDGLDHFLRVSSSTACS